MEALTKKPLECIGTKIVEERSVLDDLVIVFKISEHRKKKEQMKDFDGTISPYWENKFNSMFKGW